jgi:uncharacterized protein YjbI with pentapeptide repeats
MTEELRKIGKEKIMTTKKFLVFDKLGKLLGEFDRTDETLLTIAEENFFRANLSNKCLEDITFATVDLYESTFKHSLLQNVSFVECTGSESDFSYVAFAETKFVKADMYAVNFSFSWGNLILVESDLIEADFSFTSFKNFEANSANLSRASFVMAKIDNGSFVNADLSNADLRMATFRNVNFAGANLIGAQLDGVQADPSCFAGAYIDRETKENHPLFSEAVDAESMVKKFLESHVEKFISSEKQEDLFAKTEEFERFQKHMMTFEAKPDGLVDIFRRNRKIETAKINLKYDFKQLVREEAKTNQGELARAMDTIGGFDSMAEEVILSNPRIMAIENTDCGWMPSSDC